MLPVLKMLKMLKMINGIFSIKIEVGLPLKMKVPTHNYHTVLYRMSINRIICLPAFGSPYLVASVKSTDNSLAILQKCVQGRIESFSRKDFRLHPMFCDENPRWRMAQQMLTYAKTKVWVNEDGAKEMCNNMATIITNPLQRVGGCPHLFGDICLVVPDTFFQVVGFRPEQFTVVEECFEPEDDAEEEAKKAECLEKGWQITSMGQIYQEAC